MVAALIAGPYRGKTLTGIISFPTTWAADIQQIGQNAAQTVPLTGQTDPRKLFAAAQWLHESAGPGVDTQKAYDHLVNQIVAKSTTAERWRNLQEHEISESKLAQLETADRARGATLRNLLLTPMLEEDPRPAGALRDRPES